ncbi:MAG: GDP-mannose 4,6-dehydratase [Legionella sp.]|nr:GDP-mannose 4,6-dehydratase [Legionella sp.]
MCADKRVLITGITGFTGRYVAAELTSAGFEVHGLGQHSSNLPRYSCVNLNDRELLHSIIAEINPKIVVHLAGLAFAGADNAEAFYLINTIGTLNLLEGIMHEAPQVQCILLASSASVYGNSTEGILTEMALPNPANDYAVSKLAMEHMARLWFDRLPIIITRPFNYTGIGQAEHFLLPKIIGHFQRGAQSIELGNLDVFRDFSDVRAVANAYRRLIEACPIGETINVCSGNKYSLREAVEMVAKIMNYDIEIRVNPAFVRANEVRSLQGSVQHLRRIIGEWESPPLFETLKWMCHSSLS